MSERRRVARAAFGGVAEITAVQPDTYIVASTSELSRLGCFVTTKAYMPIGTRVGLKISYEDRIFTAFGKVVYVLPDDGIGIKFTETAPKDVAILEEWLRGQTKF